MATNNKYKIVRYGLCMNDNCPKSKAKERQQISGREEFVCKECGKPLFECPPPRSWWNKNGKTCQDCWQWLLYWAQVVSFSLSPKNNNNAELASPSVPEVIEETPVESESEVMEQVVEPTLEKEEAKPTKETVTSVRNSLDLGYATYKGRIKTVCLMMKMDV